MARVIFVHTAGIHLPDNKKTGTDIAVTSLLEEIRTRWDAVSVGICPRKSSLPVRHAQAFMMGAPPVIIDKVGGACLPEIVVRKGDRLVLADDYAGLLLRRRWRPAILVRHNALHHTYPQSPSRSLGSNILRHYHSWLATRFDQWSTSLASGVVAPAGTTENLLRRLVPGADIQPWHPRIPRLQAPIPFPDRRELAGLYFANFAYAPNREGLEFLCRQLAPLLLARPVKFRVCGPDATKAAEGMRVPANVEISDFEPDLAALAARCDFGLLPIFRGEGILLKTVTTMGFGMPMVATTQACAGTGVVDGDGALIADTLDRFVEAIGDISDFALRARLGRRAWELAEPFESRSGIIEALERFFSARGVG